MKSLFARAAVCIAATAYAIAAATKPNIVLIYGDDVGYGDFGCYGATSVSTPNIDRLASGGLRFTDAYATSATCTPSRYSLMTGEYAFRRKGTDILQGDASLIIKRGRETLPAMLARSGYKTAIVGKWHLGLGQGSNALDWNGEIKPGPLEVGFTHSFIMAATGDRVPCVYVENHRVVGLDPADPVEVSYKSGFPGEPDGVKDRASLRMDWSHGHNQGIVHGIGRIGFMKGGKAALWQDDEMAADFTREAVEFIEREKDHPFFLYFATHDIHVPRVANKIFSGKSTMGPRGDAITEFDWSAGRIVEALQRLNLLDNTLIILSSDNGPVLDDGYKDGAVTRIGDHRPAGPLRGGKYSQFEGGTRVPFITFWQGRILSGTSDALVSQVDLLASLAQLTGQPFDAKQAVDSRNLLPALLGESKVGRESLVVQGSDLALRQGDWKYIAPGVTRDKLGPWDTIRIPPSGLLYNLAEDPGESVNLAADHPEKLRELAEKLSGIRGARKDSIK